MCGGLRIRWVWRDLPHTSKKGEVSGESTPRASTPLRRTIANRDEVRPPLSSIAQTHALGASTARQGEFVGPAVANRPHSCGDVTVYTTQNNNPSRRVVVPVGWSRLRRRSWSAR